jgi:hypothetical protein
MACSPNQIERCPDLPPRPPLRRIALARRLLSDRLLSDWAMPTTSSGFAGCAMQAIAQTSACGFQRSRPVIPSLVRAPF